jgi:cytochrome P450
MVCRHAEYLKGCKLLRGIAERMLQARKEAGVTEHDTDLLSFMLRQQKEGSQVLTDKQIVDDVSTQSPSNSPTWRT